MGRFHEGTRRKLLRKRQPEKLKLKRSLKTLKTKSLNVPEKQKWSRKRYSSPSRHLKEQLVDDKRLVILSIVLLRKQRGVRPKSKMRLRRPRRKPQKLARQHHQKKKRRSQHDLGLKKRRQLNQKIQQQLQPVQHVPLAQKNKHSILCKLTAPKSPIPLYIIL